MSTSVNRLVERAGEKFSDERSGLCRIRHRFTGAFCGLLLAAATAAADPASEAEPSADAAPAATAPTEAPPAPPDYLLPDLAPAALVHDGQRFWFRPIFAVVADYTAFEQDDASLAQVGEQEDKRELRAGRVGFTLRTQGERRWELYVTADFQEKRNREKTVFTLYDLRIGIPLGPVKLYIGKQKMLFAYELTGLSVILPQQERILNPFFVTRSIGAQLSGLLADGRMTWAAGVFNDWLDTDLSRETNATDYSARVTGLAWTTPNDRDYLHLGLGYRRVGSDDGILRFSGRPESNVTDKYVDTGEFAGDHADELLLEGLLVKGPFELLAEYVVADVAAPSNGDPRFGGYYGTASWIVTGEGRPYVRFAGYAGGIRPTNRYGALELVARYSHVDLTDGAIAGGVLDKWNFGVNWWISTQWKAGVSYGDADLDRGGLLGNTKMVLFRFQWLY